MPRQRIEKLQRLDFVIKQREPYRIFGVFRRKDIEHVAMHAKRSPAKVGVVALILHFGEALDRIALRQPVTLAQVQNHAVVLGRIAYAVDRRHRRDHDAVRPLENRLGRRKPHLLDVLVDRRILLDIKIARGHIGLGLIVVVVRNEIFDRVIGKELAELRIKLRRKGLVRRQHQRRPACAGDDVGHGVRFSRARHAEQGLERQAVFDAFDELIDRLGLIAGRLKRLVKLVRAIGVSGDHRNRARD